ncbi:MAG TPA: IS3 family transposase [Longimicrobiaceae bacterium]|jgi:transposase InsO family protein|nr:IS3 family transposase [Longimicrobiaceae bacterium]
MTGYSMAAVCRTLGISRSTAYRQSRERPLVYARAEDRQVLEEIRTITRQKDCYGYRRVTARVNRLFGRSYNEKRIRRVMRLHSLQIPPKVRRRTGRAHTGKIATEQSNVRWCSDALEIACWNGEKVQVGFALDCCDREALAWVAAPRDLTGEDIRLLMSRAVEQRFPTGRTETAVQWLSDNGSIYTALETQIHAERLGLVPVTTPVRSPQSNGMSEAFVNTLKRDYVQCAELWSAEHVIALLPEWMEDYNEHAPHSALGMKSPREYRAGKTLTASL